MSEQEVTMGEFSLADLAEMNTDEIAILTSRLPAEGIYIVMGSEVRASMSPPKEEGQLPLFRYGIKTQILHADLTDKNKDGDSLVGKNLTSTETIWPGDIAESIGLLKGKYSAIGLTPTGNMGGVEGKTPGWMDTIVGHRFKIRVRHYNSNGNDRAALDWAKYENPESESEAA